MRVVPDEGVPRAPAGALRPFGLAADPFATAWSGMKNGALIRHVEAAGYAVLVTNDENMVFQQSPKRAGLAIVALPSNRRAVVLARVADIADTIGQAVPGRPILMNIDGTRTARSLGDDDAVSVALPPVPTFKG